MAGEVIHRIDSVADPSRLPYTVCVLLENLVRRAGTEHVTDADVRALANWPAPAEGAQLAFMPARVIMQDLTGVPAVVDLAALRSAVARRGGDPSRVDPQVPVDLVVDHSVQVDAFGSGAAYERNIEHEYRRNGERYALLRWAQGAFGNFRVVPPGMGIVHQVNLEYLGTVVAVRDGVAMPDTLVGTDSHTTMINALGVLGWGVGGIEAEAVMLGQPIYMTPPQVIGVRLSGGLASGVTATDLVLTMTERLRQHGVVGKFIEFFGPGLGALTVADRGTMSNMSPEFGATASTFPVDGETLRYLRDTGRTPEHVDLVERYTKEQGLFRTGDGPEPVYTETLDFDLSAVEPSLAGPRRPQDRVSLPKVGQSFADAFGAGRNGGGLGDGSVVISAITSCTNTSNPALMVAAGLVARKAVERGLTTKPWVKTSLAPGSRVVIGYLRRAGAHGAARAARLQPRRLRLHHVHRELGPAARRRGRCHRRRRPEGGGGPFGQPQLRGSHPPGGARELSRLAAARRRLRAGGHSERRPHHRAAGAGERRAGLPARRVADRRRGEPGARVVVLARPLH